MSSRTETKKLHWDVAQALVVVAAAMVFLPFLRGVLFWPAIVLGVILAGLVAIAIMRRSVPQVSKNFTPPNPLERTHGTTELIQKSLLDKINLLDWLPFEQLVASVYKIMGYNAKRCSGPSADGGVDLILIKDKSKTLVRCKHRKPAEVDEMELKDFLGTMATERIENGIFVTAREFSFSARRFAGMNSLLLVGGKDLARMLDDAGGEDNPALKTALQQQRKFCPRCEKDMALTNAVDGLNPGSRVWVCSGQPKCDYTAHA